MELVVPAQTHQIYFDIKKLKRPVTIALMVVTAMLIWMPLSTAGTGTGVGSTFNTWATTVEGWIKGPYGKLAILASLLFAIGAFAWTRDLRVIVIPAVAAVVVGIIVSLVTGSFTAVI